MRYSPVLLIYNLNMQTDTSTILCDQQSGLAFLTPPEAARLLRLSKASVYRLVETRVLPFYRVSGSLRFSKKDLEEYLTRVRVGSVSQERK